MERLRCEADYGVAANEALVVAPGVVWHFSVSCGVGPRILCCLDTCFGLGATCGLVASCGLVATCGLGVGSSSNSPGAGQFGAALVQLIQTAAVEVSWDPRMQDAGAEEPDRPGPEDSLSGSLLPP